MGSIPKRHAGTSEPMGWVRRFLSGARPGGHVLDLACGGGRHARLALENGLAVTCLDRDTSGVGDLDGKPGVTLIEADLETGDKFPFVPQSFDCVIVTNYLWRPILPDIVAAVRDNGLLIYATFAAGHTHPDGRPFRPEFLLQPNELFEAVTPEMTVVGFEHGRIESNDQRSTVQRIAAHGPKHQWAGEWPLSN